jgi:hypothetical protein
MTCPLTPLASNDLLGRHDLHDNILRECLEPFAILLHDSDGQMTGLASFYVANRARFTFVGTCYNYAMRSVCQFPRHVMLLGFSVRIELANDIVRPNGRVDAAARIQSSIAGRIMLRNTLPPLASNDLFGIAARLPSFFPAIVAAGQLRTLLKDADFSNLALGVDLEPFVVRQNMKIEIVACVPCDNVEFGGRRHSVVCAPGFKPKGNEVGAVIGNSDSIHCREVVLCTTK